MGELANEIKEEIQKQEEKLLLMKNEEMEIEGAQQKMTINAELKISDGILLHEENNLLILKEKDLAKFTSYLPK